MAKKYYEFYQEISAEELYEKFIRFGLFSDRLPDFFDCTNFFNYCKKYSKNFKRDKHGLVKFYSSRCNDVPREIRIPVPMAYEQLCRDIRDSWNDINKYFYEVTHEQKYIVSRIHIRKTETSDSLFNMNYGSFFDDGSPEIDISIGKQYRVYVDISNCFSSIYSHSIPWSIVGREQAKKQKGRGDLWFNKIDSDIMRMSDGVSSGLPIGPHASHLLSEILLCRVDDELNKFGLKNYIRNIDDYTYYASSEEDANRFISTINEILRRYNLSLNSKKVHIDKMPFSIGEKWPIELSTKVSQLPDSVINYSIMQYLLSYCIEKCMETGDASIFLFLVKIVRYKKLTKTAVEYLSKTYFSLAYTYPYLAQHVYLILSIISENEVLSKDDIGKYLNDLYRYYSEKTRLDSMSHILYNAIVYETRIEDFDIDYVICKTDCMLLLSAYIYCRRNNMDKELMLLSELAKNYLENDLIDQYWPFVYECLKKNDFPDGDWKAIKSHNVSFIKKEILGN